MTAKFVLSPRARSDLDEIWDYSVEQWGVAQTEAYIRKIWKAVQVVAEDPRRGRPCDAVRAGYMKYHAGSHVLFYRRKGKGIDIIRILHERMDFERHL